LEKYHGAGIYKLEIGGKLYVGSSKDVSKRIKSHLRAATSGKEPKALQDAFDSCGEIAAEILEKLPPTSTLYDVLQREQFWIDKLKPELNGKDARIYDPIETLLCTMERERRELCAAEDDQRYGARERHKKQAAFFAACAEDIKEQYLTPLGGEKMTSNQKAVRKYQAGRDAIMLRPSAEEGKRIRKVASDAGCSLQSFVLDAVREKIARMESEQK
jgi:group I intron endonuclease